MLAGCRHHPADAPLSPPPPVSPGPAVTLPDGGMRHTIRLAGAGWDAASAFQACARHLDDAGTPRPPFGPCLIVRGPGAAAEAQPAPDRAFFDDTSVSTAAPDGCHTAFFDVPGDPGAPAARAFLVGPSASALLDSFRPPSTVDGDQFAIETSYSPDHSRLALIHSALGLGDGDRRVDVVAVEMRAAPACR